MDIPIIGISQNAVRSGGPLCLPEIGVESKDTHHSDVGENVHNQAGDASCDNPKDAGTSPVSNKADGIP